MNGFLAGKKIVITGVASNKSIAWGCAQAMHQQGAELAFTYQNERLKSRVEEIAEATGSQLVLPLDVTTDDSIESLFKSLGQKWDGIDGIVHSIAFASRDQMEGDFTKDITRAGFHEALDISSYSFAALAKTARPLMQGRNGALVTMSYLGAVRAIPNYNIMGVAKAALEANVRYLSASLGAEGTRVNGISAGPIRTLAASGISNFKTMLQGNAENCPLKRNVTTAEVGNTASFLCSDLASGITGQIIYVDAGFNIVAVA